MSAILTLALLAAFAWACGVLVAVVRDEYQWWRNRRYSGQSWDCRCSYSVLDHADGLCER